MKSFVLLLLSFISLLLWGGYRIVASVHAEQDYIGYLKRAADANSVEMAKVELTRAVTELERQRLTNGYTSILYRTPSEDIGFWYTNLKTSLKELQDLPPNSSSLEKSNMLIKLRETLLDGGKDGENITCPDGISVYPLNTAIALWAIISLILGIISFCNLGYKKGLFK